MISDERLNQIGSYLERTIQHNPSEISALKQILTEVYMLPSYQSWLMEGHFHNVSSPDNKFTLPENFGIGMNFSTKQLLDKYMMVNGAQLNVKVDMHRERIHITDGNWVPASRRVYPYADESEALIDFAERHNAFEQVDLLIDPACGCGHHALGTPKTMQKVSSDKNLRAIAYCRINSLLSGYDDILFMDRDINRGINPIIKRVSTKSCLFLINMPFALFPVLEGNTLSPAQDGGERGIELTKAALKAVKNYMDNSVAENVLALVLCYSLGNAINNKWEIQKVCGKIFNKESYTFEILKDEKLWRVDGKKEQENPMPIKDKLSLKGRCSHTFSPDEMQKQVDGYRKLEEKFLQDRFTHLAYGVVQVKK